MISVNAVIGAEPCHTGLLTNRDYPMTTLHDITYLPRSADELTMLTNRLRCELNEHFSFAPKSQPKLEEVVLGTLGLTNGRQQWKALVQPEANIGDSFSMSLFINVTEESETDTDNEVAHLELLLDNQTVSRIRKIGESAKDLGVDMIVRDLRFKDAPSDMIEALVTDTGFFCVSYDERVKNAWPITVGQSSELSVNQLLGMYELAKSMKSTVGVTGFLPRYSEYVYLLPNVWDMNEEIKDDVLDALDSSDEDEAYKYFQSMSSGMCNTEGKVFCKESAAEMGITGPASSIYDLVLVYEEWLKKQAFFLEDEESIQKDALRTLLKLKDRIILKDTPEMLDAMAEHMEATKFAGAWGAEPSITTEIFHKIEDYRDALKNGDFTE